MSPDRLPADPISSEAGGRNERLDERVIQVAAALLIRDGRLLIAQRLKGDHLGGLWEFPGGKIEPGESFASCLQREMIEELALEVDVFQVYDEVTHAYPEKSVHIKFLVCRWRAGEATPLAAQAVAWVTRDELSRYEFPPADAVILRRLRSESWSRLEIR